MTVVEIALEWSALTAEITQKMHQSFAPQVSYLFSSVIFVLFSIKYTVCPDHLYQCEYGRVDGLQPPCIENEQRCDGVTDCSGGDDEMEHNCLCEEGAVRLVGGIVPYRGRLEYCVNRRWLAVCRFSWGSRDASVVCRQLGYPSEGIIIICIG